MEKIWFITGSSRGLGRSLTEAALAAGDKVAATARNTRQLDDLKTKYPEKLYPITLDVTDHDQVVTAVADAVRHFGRIDVLVNNAGFGVTGAAEAYTQEQVTSQLATNLFAPIDITRTVLPYMRKQRSGFIMEISSLGGRVGTAGLTIYQASKWGLSGFSEALAQEVAPLGIKVTCVEPGGFRTNWAGDSMSYAPDIEGYEETVGKRRQFFTSGKWIPVGDPDKAAQVMLKLADEPSPPIHLILGSEAITILENTNRRREEEMKKWLPVSLSTDADDADKEQFLSTEFAKRFK
ncbi:MAG: SDR family NAD(P)-dependent oxidoreductase [Bacteroidetes bacterium]|nr:SDR family NAD(P)-dependent oxidoreductase [Bacteroidota bacterium]